MLKIPVSELRKTIDRHGENAADEPSDTYRPLSKARAVGAGAEVLEIEEPVQRADQSIARSFLLFFQLLDLESQAPSFRSGDHS